MCGVFGFYINKEFDGQWEKLLFDLAKLSNSRGKEASGIAIRHQGKIEVLRHKGSILELIKDKELKNLLDKIDIKNGDLLILGHSRLCTNGDRSNVFNNQPVLEKEIVVIHNGIICNYENIWKEHLKQVPKSELDTFVIPEFLDKKIKETSIENALKNFYSIIEGDASLACLFKKENVLTLSTNTGSLYYLEDKNNALVFASQQTFIKNISKNYFKDIPTYQLKKGVIKKIELENKQYQLVDINKNNIKKIHLKRCSKCILPETFPGIKFDEHGVCSVCNNYIPYKPLGIDALKKLCEKHKKNDGSPDCILAFSGGRDSSYALHVLKVELGMNPITYTYDWGMVTDLARRNISRMCGQLGVENILVSADIPKKRKYVKQNLLAWLKRPSLGMVTLLMAGDKEYFYHPQVISKNLNIDLVFFAGNKMEQSGFKSGFCGVKESNGWYTYVPKLQKLKMVQYFFLEYLKNFRYFNSSLYDTAFAFYCAYVLKHNIHSIYDYIDWNEDYLIDVLKNNYNWETEKSSDTTWRIGDGTSAFYNYIYMEMAGFTENDTFRSSQIRQGLITRDEAMDKIANDNKPRFESMGEYAKVVGFDLNCAIEIINNASKLY